MLILPHNHDMHTESILREIPELSQFQELADVFRLLSDGNRVRIFWLLCHCEECVTNLSAAVQMSSPAVSHHLRQLKDAGLISSRREGKEVYYRALETPKTQVLHDALEKIMAITCPVEK